MSAIELDSITKRFGDLVAVDDVSLEVREGELLCLLGPSGCGKSTTLRMIGGLDRPSGGEVYIDEESVTRLPAYERDCSIVFQDWALFPHKSVLENVAFGLKMEGVKREERQKRARESLDMVKLEEYADHTPSELSGGQQQRVALARSLIVEPHVLLLDEPLSNLDKRLKEEMQIELKDIHERLNQTMIHVTHDQNEAFTLADRLGIMNDGKLVQVGEPTEVYTNPKNEFVEDFLGDTNFLQGTVQQTSSNTIIADTDLGCSVRVPIADASVAPAEGESLSISLRPENVKIRTDGARSDGGCESSVNGSVTNVIYRGSMIRFYIQTGQREVFVERQFTPDEALQTDQSVRIEWNPDRLVAFDSDGARITASGTE